MILPWPSMRDFTMLRMWSGAWLPDRSSVSRLMTEHGSAGNVMFTLMRSCCPREVSTKRWSLFFTRIKSTNSTQTSSAISTVHVMETIAPVSVRLRNSCKVFGKTSNEEKRTMRAGARRGGVGATHARRAARLFGRANARASCECGTLPHTVGLFCAAAVDSFLPAGGAHPNAPRAARGILVLGRS